LPTQPAVSNVFKCYCICVAIEIHYAATQVCKNNTTFLQVHFFDILWRNLSPEWTKTNEIFRVRA
jgi:hypothetical protein